ncbi:hypothetical protein SAMN05444266_103147 [Chitinophaga jiangningensis]|uniref:Glycosyl-4,4'-diaponeurosporenoate acyltransferase n=1 Tax=Chitinophaga jiangningensis TaxID=1419482 RepID=A0A1M7A6Q5_9BACT|nr:hypothetical protein [Chitinophaga jiangningensis]SHL38316.1 hypothetical protein SAMN05444266_103147 [Chitinophaga jiangningensis]
MKKTLSLVLISIFSIAAVAAMCYYLRMDTFSFAWALNFLLMLGALLLTDGMKSPLNSPYYDEQPWERGGKIYEILGVNFFRKLLVWIGWEKVIRKTHPLDKSSASLENLYNQTKKSELGHFIIFWIVLVINIYVAVKYGVLKSLWLLVLNLLMHVYPIFLQRYNRPRFKRAMYLSRLRTAGK